MRTRTEWLTLLANLKASHAKETNRVHKQWLAGQIKVVTEAIRRKGIETNNSEG